jgi:hypothetical protein
MARTDPHTTTNYMVGGLVESPAGEEVLMCVMWLRRPGFKGVFDPLIIFLPPSIRF